VLEADDGDRLWGGSVRGMELRVFFTAGKVEGRRHPPLVLSQKIQCVLFFIFVNSKSLHTWRAPNLLHASSYVFISKTEMCANFRKVRSGDVQIIDVSSPR
jgi:hypothetical protein